MTSDKPVLRNAKAQLQPGTGSANPLGLTRREAPLSAYWRARRRRPSRR
jgi:hypothetical protein